MNKLKKITKIDGMYMGIPEIFYDHRGEYLMTYHELNYKKKLKIKFLEDDISFSKKNVFRGLHGDKKTFKLIQCLYGSIDLYVLDLRKKSITFLNLFKINLNAKNRYQILIPPGCANGHHVKSSECIFSYKQSAYYKSSKFQFTVNYKDPILKNCIDLKNPILSQRDKDALYIDEKFFSIWRL